MRLLQITDLHLTRSPGRPLAGWDTWGCLKTILDVIARDEPVEAGLLLTGDLVHDGEKAAYERLRLLLADTGRQTHVLPGNHDHPARMARVFNQSWPDVRALGPHWALHLLNTHDPGRDGGRLGATAIAQLGRPDPNSPARWQLAAMHHPPLPVGSAWLDRIGLANAEACLEACARNPRLKGLLCGHVHQAAAYRHGGLEMWCTPSTHRQFARQSRDFAEDTEALPGYRRLLLNPDGGLHTEVVLLAECKRHYQAGKSP